MIWASHIQFPGYTFSSCGHVYSKTLRHLRTLSTTRFGYHYISLWKNNKETQTHVHKIVAELFIGPRPKGCDIDHTDRNKKNNKKENLRYLSRRLNNMNSGLRKDNTTGHKGVYLHKPNGKWTARYKLPNGGSYLHLGMFETKEQAIEARRTYDQIYSN